MKTCFKCGADKDLSEFYKHPQMGDGLLGKCKECTKRDSNEHRTKNIDRVMAYDRKRQQTEERREKKLVYQKNLRSKHPQKVRARALIAYAVKIGKIDRRPCELCGGEAEAHHDDYSRPLDVRWLCFKHHRELHGNSHFSAA